MRERSRLASGRTIVIAGLFIVLPLCGAVVACTAGDEISYDKAGFGKTDGGDGGADSGIPKVIVPSDAPVRPEVDDGGTYEASAPFPCSDGLTPDDQEDGGCQVSSGYGCCLRGASGAKASLCYERVQVELGTACHQGGETFLTCLGSRDDSVCCFYKGAGNTTNSRFRADCDGGIVEACDPTGPSPVRCQNGLGCVAQDCHGVTIGTCGPAPASVCPQ